MKDAVALFIFIIFGALWNFVWHSDTQTDATGLVFVPRSAFLPLQGLNSTRQLEYFQETQTVAGLLFSEFRTDAHDCSEAIQSRQAF